MLENTVGPALWVKVGVEEGWWLGLADGRTDGSDVSRIADGDSEGVCDGNILENTVGPAL